MSVDCLDKGITSRGDLRGAAFCQGNQQNLSDFQIDRHFPVEKPNEFNRALQNAHGMAIAHIL